MPLPPVIILSGPSGTGKSTLIAQLLARGGLPLHLSVSATTRAPRPGEREGVHYHFWDRGRFEEAIRKGEFLEWAEVHGNLYGTLRDEVEPYRRRGELVILDIDVQGAGQVRRQGLPSVSIFLRAPTEAAYEERLRRRGTDEEATLRRRLAGARVELARAGEFDYQVVNDDLDRAVAQVYRILENQVERDAHAG